MASAVQFVCLFLLVYCLLSLLFVMLLLDVLFNWLVVIFIHSPSPPNNDVNCSFDAVHSLNPDEELQQSLLWELVVLTHCSSLLHY